MKYLFIYFIGEQEDGEQVYFSVSSDGLHWEDLNQGKPVLRSCVGEKGIRDPFVVRDSENDRFYMMATDLRIGAGKGWEEAQYRGSRNLIIWESENLADWSGPRSCTVGVPEAGCVWAPESVYDQDEKAFFVFWASMVQLVGESEPKQRIYGSYTRDFRNFTEPFIYLETGNHVIDMNIVRAQGWYYRFVKDETTKGIKADRVRILCGESAQSIHSEILEKLLGVEGPEAYELPDGRWCLIADQFASGGGYLPLVCSELEKGDFEVLSHQEYDLGKLKKRHGCILKITNEEYLRLKNRY